MVSNQENRALMNSEFVQRVMDSPFVQSLRRLVNPAEIVTNLPLVQDEIISKPVVEVTPHPDRLPNGAIPLKSASMITIPSRYYSEFGQFGLDGLMTGVEYIARTDAMLARYPGLKPLGKDTEQDLVIMDNFHQIPSIAKQCELSQVNPDRYYRTLFNIYQGAPKAWQTFFSQDMTS